jgi:hypothetical protein
MPEHQAKDNPGRAKIIAAVAPSRFIDRHGKQPKARLAQW